MTDNKNNKTEKQEINVSEAWTEGKKSWSNPSIPNIIPVRTREERKRLGKIGDMLNNELAFMKYPEFQTYENLERIVEEFPDEPQKALKAINKHEISHRFCPYDLVTSILLSFEISKTLKGGISGGEKEKIGNILDLFTDMNGNTNLVRRGDEDIVWLYNNLSKKYLKDSSLGRVYARSMELAWKKQLLPEEIKLTEKEQEASKNINELYSGDYFNKSNWRSNVRQYSMILSDFLEESDKSDNQKQNNSSSRKNKNLMKKLKEKIFGDEKDSGKQEGDKKGDADKDKSKQENTGKEDKIIYGPDNISSNIPDSIDDKTAEEIAKRLAEIGTNGIPTNPSGLRDFRDLMTGFGRGDPKKASLSFYEMLANSYDVVFSTQPFGRPRVNPFQPVKWNPGMSADKLDIDYSFNSGGRLIPGVTTYAWNSRKREFKGGIEEIVPDIDIYLDTSSSTANPLEEISLGALAGIVLARKAHRKNAYVRGTNFSGKGQFSTVGFTRDLKPVLENFMVYYGGGTILPIENFLESRETKQVVIITDTYLANKDETAEAIRELIKKDKKNKVTIYAVSSQIDKEYLEKAGAEVIQDTSTNIFKKAIGKANEVYGR